MLFSISVIFTTDKNIINILKSFIRKQLRVLWGVFLSYNQSVRETLFLNFFLFSFKQQRCVLSLAKLSCILQVGSVSLRTEFLREQHFEVKKTLARFSVCQLRYIWCFTHVKEIKRRTAVLPSVFYILMTSLSCA